MSWLSRARDLARGVKSDVLTVFFAARDPEMPAALRWLALGIAAYALSPIDLIPDFIPILGYLDDLLIVPLGILVIIRLTPPSVLQRARENAAAAGSRPTVRSAAIAIVCVWIVSCVACSVVFARWYASR